MKKYGYLLSLINKNTKI